VLRLIYSYYAQVPVTPFRPILESSTGAAQSSFVHPNMPGYEVPGVAPASVLGFPVSKQLA